MHRRRSTSERVRVKIDFPSREFDDAVAAVCHGTASDAEVHALNELLRFNPAARDEYIIRIELHARLASVPDLFVGSGSDLEELSGEKRKSVPPSRFDVGISGKKHGLTFAAAACVAFIAISVWVTWHFARRTSTINATSRAVAMLSQTIDAHWNEGQEPPKQGAPLDPGRLKLKEGLAQIVFYSGARVVIKGPAELQLISSNRAFCRFGKIVAEVPPEARGFRVDTPQGVVTDLGTSLGIEVNDDETELHVFKGKATLQPVGRAAEETLREGDGARITTSHAPRAIAANSASYAALLNVQQATIKAQTLRFEHWRAASEILNRDVTLRVHFDFEHSGPASWQLQNVAEEGGATREATIVGCQFVGGRWLGKRALEFQSVSDRVRLNVPGEFTSATFSAWVRVHGLDRKLNSIFMCDGFAPGTLHWLIRNDGALGLTIVGERTGNYQLAISPPAITLERYGMWLHLAVVIDGHTGRVTHYINGQPVAELGLKIPPPYRMGAAELGNWNGKGFPEGDPFMIRNFSGAIDDFCFFERALDGSEIQKLYTEGRPDAEAVSLDQKLPTSTTPQP